MMLAILSGKKQSVMRLGILVSASSIIFGCGSPSRQGESSQVTATPKSSDPAPSLSKVELFQGYENGGVCALSVEKDQENNVIKMKYVSEKCQDPAGGMCKLELDQKSTDGGRPDFGVAASIQFPGYTRIGLSHGISSPSPGALTAYDQFILAKNNFTTLKVVRRLSLVYVLPIPVPFNWTSDCLNLQKIDLDQVKKL